MSTSPIIKMISRNNVIRTAVSWAGANYIRAVDKSSFWRFDKNNIPEGFSESSQPYIASFWHGRLMMMGSNWSRSIPFYMLISGHSDGKLIAQIIKRLGFNTLEGSSKKGGVRALRAMLSLLKDGNCIGITPDGPRGPRMRAGMGVITLAKLSGVPILPTTYSTSRRKILGSWDRFLIAGMFGKGVFLWGSPIWVPKDASQDEMERLRQILENTLNELTDQADSECGQTKIEPGPKNDG